MSASRATRALLSGTLTDRTLQDVWGPLGLSRHRLGVVLMGEGRTLGSLVVKEGALLEAVDLRTGITGITALGALAEATPDRFMIVEVLTPVANERSLGRLADLWAALQARDAAEDADDAPTVVMGSMGGDDPLVSGELGESREAEVPDPAHSVRSRPALEDSSIAPSPSHGALRFELLINDLALQRQRLDRMVVEMRTLEQELFRQDAVAQQLRSRQVLTHVAIVALVVVIGGLIAGLVGLATYLL